MASETTQIRLSSYKQDSMVYGAAIIAIHNIFQNSAQYFETEKTGQASAKAEETVSALS